MVLEKIKARLKDIEHIEKSYGAHHSGIKISYTASRIPEEEVDKLDAYYRYGARSDVGDLVEVVEGQEKELKEGRESVEAFLGWAQTVDCPTEIRERVVKWLGWKGDPDDRSFEDRMREDFGVEYRKE